MTDPVPSKEWTLLDEAREYAEHLKATRFGGYTVVEDLANEIVRLREDCRRWENAHKILLSENERFRKQVGELSVHAEKWVKRALTPAHEREPPHCSNCSCGLAPEPAADLAKWLRQEASFWRDDAFENAAKICERYEAHDAARDIRHLKGSSQPPGDVRG